jgi:hypothetical protein
MEGRIPLGRTGVPEDLVGPAVFLGSELSGYVVSKYQTSRQGDGSRGTVLTRTDRLVRNCWLMAGCSSICSKDMVGYYICEVQNRVDNMHALICFKTSVMFHSY